MGSNPRIRSVIGDGLKGPRYVQHNGTPDGKGRTRFPVEVLLEITGQACQNLPLYNQYGTTLKIVPPPEL